MIITRKYAQKLIRQGNATLTGAVRSNGLRYDVITRWDYQRIDHVPANRQGYTLSDAWEQEAEKSS